VRYGKWWLLFCELEDDISVKTKKAIGSPEKEEDDRERFGWFWEMGEGEE
jgi:hypothetical protein